jgi:shikimate kinase
MSIPDFFKKYSEEVFRKEETTLIKNIYKKQNLTISTGGGVIENSKNIELLKQNGVIIFLNKDPNQIAKKEIFGRPLIKSAHDVLNLAKKRIPLYINACDILIDIDKDTVYHMYEIEEKFNEYINY